MNIKHFSRSICSVGPLRSAVVVFRHRGFRQSDVFLASYPKSGNTWLRHLIVHAATGKETKWRDVLTDYSLMVGQHGTLLSSIGSGGRLIKTHEPFRNQYKKSILMVRDPRDIAVSEFHYRKQFSNDRNIAHQTFSEYIDRFVRGKTCVYGSWHAHCESWLPAVESKSALLVKYEDLQQSPIDKLDEMVRFLGFQINIEVLGRIVEANSAESMREKERVYRKQTNETEKVFVRHAKPAGWQELLSSNDIDVLRDKLGHVSSKLGYEL